MSIMSVVGAVVVVSKGVNPTLKVIVPLIIASSRRSVWYLSKGWEPVLAG